MRNLMTLLKEKSVNWNKGANPIKISMASAKLKQSALPEIPNEFAKFLKIFNGASNDGAIIFGVEVGSMFFIDLVEYNKSYFKNNPSMKVILGYDENSFFIYDNNEKKYAIVNKGDFEQKLSSENISEPISYLLRLK